MDHSFNCDSNSHEWLQLSDPSSDCSDSSWENVNQVYSDSSSDYRNVVHKTYKISLSSSCSESNHDHEENCSSSTLDAVLTTEVSENLLRDNETGKIESPAYLDNINISVEYDDDTCDSKDLVGSVAQIAAREFNDDLGHKSLSSITADDPAELSDSTTLVECEAKDASVPNDIGDVNENPIEHSNASKEREKNKIDIPIGSDEVEQLLEITCEQKMLHNDKNNLTHDARVLLGETQIDLDKSIFFTEGDTTYCETKDEQGKIIRVAVAVAIGGILVSFIRKRVVIGGLASIAGVTGLGLAGLAIWGGICGLYDIMEKNKKSKRFE